MNNYSKNLIAFAIAIILLALMACKSVSNMDDFEIFETEYMVSNSTYITNDIVIDTIPDPNPEEPENPEEEPEQEPEVPEEDPDPIPDTTGVSSIKYFINKQSRIVKRRYLFLMLV